MADANYVLLEKITVGSAGASSVTFSGIPQTGYTDLVVKISPRESSTNSGVTLCKINSSTTGYTAKQLYGTGSAAASDSNYITAAGFGPDGTSNPSNATANTFSNSEWYFPNYTSANNKSISVDGVNETNATGVNMAIGAFLLSNTAAITSLTFAPYSGTYAQYSTFYLYGVAKLDTTPAIVPYATGGDTIMTDGTYWYHAFKSSGTFTPAKGLSCDVLVVAGGGGGIGGGGGAGGVLYTASQSVASNSSNTVTIGGGGVGPGAGNQAPNGSNSSFSSLVATGGGGGAQYGYVGANGGSGGGGAQNQNGGTGTSGQGTNGGRGNDTTGGGGGGAGVAGGAGSGSTGGAGGNGTSTYSSWGSITGTGQNVSGTYYFAGGGGGGASTTGGVGGFGGGGAGSPFGAPTTGTANTGGGAGGGYSSIGTNLAGGSGIVIVRYAV